MSFEIARIAHLGSLLARTAITSAEVKVSALTEPEFTDTLEDEVAYVQLEHLENLMALVACSALIHLGYPLSKFENALYDIGARVENATDLWLRLGDFASQSVAESLIKDIEASYT